jgi:hypothetical protein
VSTVKRLVTISVPVLNEADDIKPLVERLRAVADTQRRYDFEFLFADNASTDAAFERANAAARSPISRGPSRDLMTANSHYAVTRRSLKFARNAR